MDDKNASQTRARAEARLHRRLGTAHEEYAREISLLIEEPDDQPVPELRGPVQRRIIALPGMYAERGMSAGEIARTLDYDEPNTYPVLKSLSDSRVAEQVEGATPKRWRMAVKHRRNRVLRMSRLIPDGRWTTYGDFAIAVYDSNKMAITVGRVAAKNPAFVKPQRVLWSGGEIKDTWQDDEGKGPKECERRLEAEGIRIESRHADPKAFIGWADLKGLLEADERADDPEEPSSLPGG
jgi:alkylated DNA nucleotide flippase Atl1